MLDDLASGGPVAVRMLGDDVVLWRSGDEAVPRLGERPREIADRRWLRQLGVRTGAA